MTAALPAWISLLPVVLLWATLLTAGCATGCAPDTRGLQTLGVEPFAALREAGVDLTVVDANSADTREKYGVIPGAILLTSYRDYDRAELPADRSRRIVFYCHSPMCGAAADAARRAVAWGWQDVWVMTDGIRGWTRAGLPVERPVTVSAR